MITRVLLTIAIAMTAAWQNAGAAEPASSSVTEWVVADEPMGFDTPCEPLPFFLAQGEPPMDSNVRPRLMRRGSPGGPEMRKHLEQLRMLKLLEFLDLKEDQEVAFLTRFRQMRSAEDELEARRKDHVEKLTELVTAESPDERAIRAAIDSVQTTMQERVRAFDAFIGDVRGLLTPVQMGKLVIFQDRFEYELLERVRSFQERRGGRSMQQFPDDSQ